MSVSVKVTVIIPNYNHFRYLPQRIESVLNQNFSDIEVIILDDCSQDSSRELILEYAALDPRIKHVFNTVNSKSVFRQWAKGLEMASGEFVWIAESDDFADADFLSTLVPILERNSDVSFAFSNSLIVDEDNNPIEKISEAKQRYFGWDHWNNDFVQDGKQELRNYLSLQCTVNNASAVLFRRCSIEKAGGVDTSFRYTGDWMMYIKMCLQGHVAYNARCLNNYREHAVNASKKSFSDGSQLFERQKCFAFSYNTGILDRVATERLITLASVEFLELQHYLIGKNKLFAKMATMIFELCKIDARYFFIIQSEALKKTNIWKKVFMRNLGSIEAKKSET